MSAHSPESIIRVAQSGPGGLVLNGKLSAESVIRVIQSTSVPIVVKAGARSAESLIRIVHAGGKRITIDFGDDE